MEVLFFAYSTHLYAVEMPPTLLEAQEKAKSLLSLPSLPLLQLISQQGNAYIIAEEPVWQRALSQRSLEEDFIVEVLVPSKSEGRFKKVPRGAHKAIMKGGRGKGAKARENGKSGGGELKKGSGSTAERTFCIEFAGEENLIGGLPSAILRRSVLKFIVYFPSSQIRRYEITARNVDTFHAMFLAVETHLRRSKTIAGEGVDMVDWSYSFSQAPQGGEDFIKETDTPLELVVMGGYTLDQIEGKEGGEFVVVGK